MRLGSSLLVLVLGGLPAPSSHANELYAIKESPGRFLSVDSNTGGATLIGETVFSQLAGAAYDPDQDVVYGSDVDGDRLVSIDPDTGAATAVGPFQIPQINIVGLAFDPNTRTLYGSDTVSRGLVQIDTSTGQATPIGAFGFSQVIAGLAYDPNTNTMYGSNISTNELFTIATGTGAATRIGALGFTRVDGLAFDPVDNLLYGTDVGTDQLLRINTATGQATAVGDLGFTLVGALAPARGPTSPCPLVAFESHLESLVRHMVSVEAQPGMLKRIRSFRDNVLRTTKDGRRMVKLYYANRNEMRNLWIRNPMLATRSLTLLATASPQFSWNGPRTFTLTSDEWDSGIQLLREHRRLGNPKLRASLGLVEQFLRSRAQRRGRHVHISLHRRPQL